MYYHNYTHQSFCCPFMNTRYFIDSRPSPVAGDGSFPIARGSGDTEVDFTTDPNGNFNTEVEQFGAGINANMEGWILYPDARYDITVQSSDGGGGTWNNVGVNQHVNCTIKTSLWHKTRLRITLHSSVSDTSGRVHIHYEY